MARMTLQRIWNRISSMTKRLHFSLLLLPLLLQLLLLLLLLHRLVRRATALLPLLLLPLLLLLHRLVRRATALLRQRIHGSASAPPTQMLTGTMTMLSQTRHLQLVCAQAGQHVAGPMAAARFQVSV
jgi:hypothetical protein